MDYATIIPDYQSLMLPLLRAVAKRKKEIRVPDVVEELAAELHLSSEALNATYASGTRIFPDRLHWAKSYLNRAGVLESARRGYFKISDRGEELLKENLQRIDNKVLARYPEFAWAKSSSESSAATQTTSDDIASPDDQISEGYDRIHRTLTLDLLERIRSAPASFFENLIIDVLVAMGFGGGKVEASKTLGRSGDGGIDGVINEDALGLDVVYVQAKRYAANNTVPISSVRDFVGSLDAKRAAKGVFVTSSTFPPGAYQFAKDVSKRIVLIDGTELVNLMIKFDVGVRTKNSYVIKAIDEDYFVEE